LVGEINVEQKDVWARDERFRDELFGGLRFVDDLDVAVRKKGKKAGADDGALIGDDEANGHKRSFRQTGVKSRTEAREAIFNSAPSIIPSQGGGVKKRTRFSWKRGAIFSSAPFEEKKKRSRRVDLGRDASGKGQR
jgi:hypothetical protein